MYLLLDKVLTSWSIDTGRPGTLQRSVYRGKPISYLYLLYKEVPPLFVVMVLLIFAINDMYVYGRKCCVRLHRKMLMRFVVLLLQLCLAKDKVLDCFKLECTCTRDFTL